MSDIDASAGHEAGPKSHEDVARDEQGVDLTLIREMLELEPLERLRLNDRAANAALELRRAFAREA